MNLHECQSKRLIAQHAIPVLRGEAAGLPDEAAAAETLGGLLWAVKAEAHADGRRRAGGVSEFQGGAAGGAAPEIGG